ncbi:LamG domain protein jellyroll fold domain protein [Chthoniobacter flavus Ellin428]|uniref:LamG domain protein jellyroll fold domain protein n=1 Tax=Chthoniobacter flavus Ellin428 TaxID=497964 RepID=B4D5Z2_9BACT|nr:LamG-like jellyroll fold domain-containing protein [Chthoniobacter flavus]EDY18195.1 LamG domain protein jellyroll fold domain protein [Chthoniobacter flavus Ellin428]TCO91452.1 FecR family protein [Chthoniobacter flavus]
MDSARLERLLDRYLDEALTPEEKTEVEGMLRTSPQARQTFWERARFHALLREAGAEGRGRELAQEPDRRWLDVLARLIGLLQRHAGWAVAAAAVIVAVVGIWMAWRQIEARGDQTTSAVAVLTEAVDMEWAPGTGDHAVGGPLSPGWLRFDSGLAQIEFNDGARVIVEGPAELEIRSRSEAYCREGRLSAQVPAAAHGFKIGSPKMTVVDLGTTFGFETHAGAAQVHVFEGKVQIADARNAPKKELLAGQALSVDADGQWREITATASLFPSSAALQQKAASSWQKREADWKLASSALQGDPTLILHYTFESDSNFDRRLPNVAHGEPRASDGAIVGCRWAEGRWPGKGALEFKGAGDGVRVEIPGVFDALTLAAWVRVDGLDHNFNSLLMADAFDRGAMHWQITKKGTVKLGLAGAGDFDTPVIFLPERLGQWVHLAVVVDRAGHRVAHYVDGAEVSTAAFKIDLPLGFGRAEVGTWNPAPRQDRTPVRTFNGRMDEMLVFRRALSAQEVRDLARNALRPAPSPQ